ncbi:uncharacterized protein LOC111715412 [Eurytemora carolleeae]|uniref:uncharacterized protein LOC111715412 n=1 Tax=Eurytemora carolleeae TaxID=1294199 RepID=UPI000C7868EA|nr:uncharacterized protein LOC111715412 [Eurytemora carolleeae]|eukprot:XP_023346492.1 uncharacterized protein LOC111715412 [Eurytemora affinis]
MCTKSLGGDSCEGDSGGPLFFQQGEQFFQAGVISSGHSLLCGEGTGFSTDLKLLGDWVRDNIEGEFETWQTSLGAEKEEIKQDIEGSDIQIITNIQRIRIRWIQIRKHMRLREYGSKVQNINKNCPKKN